MSIEPRKRGRQAEAERNNVRILEAAREVFIANPAAPISEVALRAGVGITSLTVSGPDGPAWQFGTNPGLLDDARLARHPDTTTADLFLNPDSDLDGRAFRRLGRVERRSDRVTLGRRG